MWSIVKRNLLYTVRDKTAFALSFLSIAILIVLYKAFLGDFQLDALKTAAHLKTVSTAGQEMVNYWLIGGLTIVTSVTSVLSALGVVVDDHVLGKQQDFRISGSSPIKIFISYYLAAIILGFSVTLLSLILGILIFVGLAGLSDFNGLQWVQLAGYSLLGNVFGVLLGMPVVILLKSRSGFSSLSTIVGTLIGFIAGIYISIGNVNNTIKALMLSTPLVHEVALIKNILMTKSKSAFFGEFPSVAGKLASKNYDKLYGNQLYFPGTNRMITMQQSLLFILVWIVGLLIVNLFVLKIVVRKR